MKVILVQEVPGVGSPGDVVDVADGFGRNYLLPRKFARPATKGAVVKSLGIRDRRRAREVADLEQARTLAAHLESLRVSVPAKAGAGGRLFGSVTTTQLAEAIGRVGGAPIDKRRIHLPAPIKNLGTHELAIRLHPEVEAVVNVEITKAS